MRKTWVMALLAAGAVWVGGGLATAETRHEPVPVQWGDEKLPKLADLKFAAGKEEGFKTPLEVVTRAVKAAKESKLDELKSCYAKRDRARLDDATWVDGKDTTHLKVIAGALAKFDPAKMKELKQNTFGKYGVVLAISDTGTHALRCHIAGGNWRLKDTWYEEYTRDYMAGMSDLRKAITSGVGAEVKKFVDPEGAKILDLLVGVQDGADPYDMLAKKLKTLTSAGVEPHWLLHYFSNEVALWFHTEKGDQFLVIRQSPEWDQKTHSFRNTPQVHLDGLARFNKTPGQSFQYWVSNYDSPDPDAEDGKDG